MGEKTVKDHILEALEDLPEDQLENFKTKLNEVKVETGYSRIPRGKLEKMKPLQLANAIVDYYRGHYGGHLTLQILEQINEKPLADTLRAALNKGGACGSSVPSATNSQGKAGGKHFVDQHREAIIQGISVVMPILDQLLDLKLLTMEKYSVVWETKTSQEQMRVLYKYVNSWGPDDKDKFFQVLLEKDGPLVKNLQSM